VPYHAVPRHATPDPATPGEAKNEPSGAVAPPTDRPPAWNVEAFGDYAEFQGEPQGEARKRVAIRISKALKPLVDVRTWALVRPAWRKHLESEGKYSSPERFAERPGQWMEPPGRAAPDAKPTPKPRALQRDDRAATGDELAIIRAGRGDEH
jgi:hypothetical protein